MHCTGDWLGSRTGLHSLNNTEIFSPTGINVNFSLLLAMKLLRRNRGVVLLCPKFNDRWRCEVKITLDRFSPGRSPRTHGSEVA